MNNVIFKHFDKFRKGFKKAQENGYHFVTQPHGAEHEIANCNSATAFLAFARENDVTHLTMISPTANTSGISFKSDREGKTLVVEPSDWSCGHDFQEFFNDYLSQF